MLSLSQPNNEIISTFQGTDVQLFQLRQYIIQFSIFEVYCLNTKRDYVKIRDCFFYGRTAVSKAVLYLCLQSEQERKGSRIFLISIKDDQIIWTRMQKDKQNIQKPSSKPSLPENRIRKIYSSIIFRNKIIIITFLFLRKAYKQVCFIYTVRISNIQI